MKITASFRKNHMIQKAISDPEIIAKKRGSHSASRPSGEMLLVKPGLANFELLSGLAIGVKVSGNSHCWEIMGKTPAGITIQKHFNRNDVTTARRTVAARKLVALGQSFDGTASLKKLLTLLYHKDLSGLNVVA